jgi:RNA polymerase sigma factor (sigma-70 family)
MNRNTSDDAFATILTLLHRRARSLVASPDEAADLAQDTALKLWQQMCNGAEPDDLVAYAMTALRNQARSRWRTHRPWQELHDDMATTAPEAPGRIACAELRVALSRLPKSQGELMALVATGETSPAALARITGQPLGTVMSRLARARATLRGDLGLEQSAPVRSLYASDCEV